MAKNLTFVIDKTKFQAAITKVDRDKVYGFVEEAVTDKQGSVCMTANLLDDGKTLILSGATALKTVDEKMQEVDKSTLKTVYLDGSDAVLIPSSYDGEIKLESCSLDDLFDLQVDTMYQLTWEDETSKKELLSLLQDGSVFRFVFNYRADYEGADAVVVGNGVEVFVLTGRLQPFEYLENKAVLPPEEPAELQTEEEEVDFGML
jgi:hypothetical protein